MLKQLTQLFKTLKSLDGMFVIAFMLCLVLLMQNWP